MLQNFWNDFVWLIGGNEIDAKLAVWQVILRTIIIYIAALLIIRFGKRRFMGSYSSFDILLGFVIGSILSRGITGAIRFIDMFFAVVVLVALHWLISIISFYSRRFSKIIKNTPRKLIVGGEIQKDAMRKSKIGKNDLLEAVREEVHIDSLDKVETAYLERDGNITVIPKDSKPHLVEVKVEEGVQTIKIVIEH